MAIHGVNPKCYILALFVRDDGTRFLLGDDPFEFKDNQLHFQPNTMANDVVEVQGNDGYLLAGQVRRPGTQMFDGYVCNGTNSKEEVEVKRRSFLQFFRRSHFYKVIYVFPNGAAIQRKQGFLVDDPTVQELYQQYPEYHVALNFEDVNYYTYEEDDQGHEIYAKEAIVPLARGGATGGLICDSYGVVWEDAWSLPLSISGVQFQILNNAGARAPIENVELYGDTFQQTYSGKNLCSSVVISSNNALRLYFGNQSQVSQTFTLSFICPTLATSPKSVDVFVYYNGSANTGKVANVNAVSGQRVSATVTLSDGQWTSLKNGSNGFIQLYGSAAWTGTTVDGYGEPQIEAGSSVSSYEPYTGGIPAPNPDYPQAVQVVTGEQTINISDGVTSQSYPINLGFIELCKIGDYQDYIYKSGDNWYIHKETGRKTYSGSDVYLDSHSYTNIKYAAAPKPTDSDAYGVYGQKLMYCTHASATGNTGTWDSAQNIGKILSGAVTNVYWFGFPPNTTLDTMQTALDGSVLYYVLATPTDTKITDATLMGQLEALGSMKLFIGENNVLVSTPTPNLPATLAFDYYTKFVAIGAEWEEGGTKGATIVDVDAIDNTYPVWELTGPATNPTLSVLTTNTTLTYNGTITASQKLVIDMFNKTATLNGTSVIGNISGDFVYMAPGTNRVAYTAGNTDAPDSSIYWQEVVG